MSPQQQLEKFAQSIYLVIKNRYYDDIQGEDGQVFVEQIVDWTNMFVDELESETDPDQKPVDWWFARQSAFALGTAAEGDSSINLPSTVNRLLTNEERFVQITVGGKVVSSWSVVHPSEVGNRTDRVSPDKCALVGTEIMFSRPFKDTEDGGVITGDVMTILPRITYTTQNGLVVPTNLKLLTTVKPALLLKLGVAKNATLPDIVQGGLSPSYTQKFTDLLGGAIARSLATSQAKTAAREDYGRVGGVY